MGLRAHKDMTDDPRYPFMVGRLVGAAEATALVIDAGKLSAAELTDVGKNLHKAASWFLDTNKADALDPWEK